MTESTPPLRLASYNIHGCVGLDRRFDPARIAEVIASIDPDIVGLQEVEDRNHFGRSVCEYLGSRLNLHVSYGPTLKRGTNDYGNVILSRARPVETRLHDLSFGRREPRGAIDADFDIAGRRVRVLVAHLGLRGRERRQQFEQLQTLLDDRQSDAELLLGDFNEWRLRSRLHRRLGQRFDDACRRRTFPSPRPMLSLDGIYARGGTLEDKRRVNTPPARSASDHLPIAATFIAKP